MVNSEHNLWIFFQNTLLAPRSVLALKPYLMVFAHNTLLAPKSVLHLDDVLPEHLYVEST